MCTRGTRKGTIRVLCEKKTLVPSLDGRGSPLFRGQQQKVLSPLPLVHTSRVAACAGTAKNLAPGFSFPSSEKRVTQGRSLPSTPRSVPAGSDSLPCSLPHG